MEICLLVLILLMNGLELDLMINGPSRTPEEFQQKILSNSALSGLKILNSF